jgi:hypothetical protein
MDTVQNQDQRKVKTKQNSSYRPTGFHVNNNLPPSLPIPKAFLMHRSLLAAACAGMPQRMASLDASLPACLALHLEDHQFSDATAEANILLCYSSLPFLCFLFVILTFFCLTASIYLIVIG